MLTWTDNTRLTASFTIRPRGRTVGGTADVVARVKRLFELTELSDGHGVPSPYVDLDRQ
jgi:hypothetical protein